VLRYTEKSAKAMPWLTGIVARRPYKVAAVALANKMARIVWAVLTRGGVYQRGNSLAAATVTS
jgi:transposase